MDPPPQHQYPPYTIIHPPHPSDPSAPSYLYSADTITIQNPPMDQLERYTPQDSSQTQHHQPSSPTDLVKYNSSIQLTVVQQPREALVTQLGKEKMRKPIDPPPVVQMVLPTDKDPQQIYTHSPYLYCLATLVEEHSLNPVTDSKGVTVLLGTIVSSINRLKDNRDNESAFFVFADMSVRKQGRFRLLFSVFETKPHEGTTIFVKNVVSNTFKVVASKDYSGLEESTAMSRTFADQGVKLRLRKETRGSTSRKRERDDGDDEKPRRARQETKRARSDERRDDNIYASNTWTSPQQPATQQYHNTLDSIQCTVPQTVTAYENPNNYPLVARQTNTDIGDCQQAILQRQMWRYY